MPCPKMDVPQPTPWESYSGTQFQPSVPRPPTGVSHPPANLPHPPMGGPQPPGNMSQPTWEPRPPTSVPHPPSLPYSPMTAPPTNMPHPPTSGLHLPTGGPCPPAGVAHSLIGGPRPPLSVPHSSAGSSTNAPCVTGSQPHPLAGGLHPPAIVPRPPFEAPSPLNEKQVSSGQNPPPPQPLFNSADSVHSSSSTTIAQVRPLFGAPPAGFPLPSHPPLEGTPMSRPPQPSDRPDASHGTGQPHTAPPGPTQLPNHEENPPNLQPDMELDSDSEYEDETSEKEHNSSFLNSARSAEDESRPSHKLNHSQDRGMTGDMNHNVGQERSDRSHPWSGESEYIGTRLNISRRDGLDTGGNEREAPEMSTERSSNRGGMGPDKELCGQELQVASSRFTPGFRTSRPGFRSGTTWTSTAASRPPAFAAGVVEEEEEGEGGKKEGDTSQRDQVDDTGDLGQGNALESIREGYSNHPEEQIPGHLEERLPGHPGPSGRPGHPGRHGHPSRPGDRWYPPEQYVDHSFSGRRYPGNEEEHYVGSGEEHYDGPCEDHYGGPGEQYDEYYPGRPNERHPDEGFSGQPNEDFPGPPDECYSRRADYYSEHPHDDYFPPGHPDEHFPGRFNDYSGRPDGPYHDDYGYPEHPDRRFHGHPDDRYHDEHYFGHPDEHERYPGRPDPFLTDGGPHYRGYGPRRHDDGPHGYRRMDSQYEDWREERDFHPRNRAYLLGECIS